MEKPRTQPHQYKSVVWYLCRGARILFMQTSKTLISVQDCRLSVHCLRDPLRGNSAIVSTQLTVKYICQCIDEFGNESCHDKVLHMISLSRYTEKRKHCSHRAYVGGLTSSQKLQKHCALAFGGYQGFHGSCILCS